MKDSDDTCHYLTGLSWSVFDIVCSYITPYLKLPRTNIQLRNQILTVLVRLRINLPFEYISHQAGISKSTANLTFHKILDLLFTKLHFLIQWQDRDNIRQTVPPIFKQHFPKLTCIIDCFEIFIYRPVNLKAWTLVYSNYKKHSTVKYLFSCSPLGAINFLSNGWGGRATDTYIVRISGFRIESVPKFFSKYIFGATKTLHCKLECNNLYLHITLFKCFSTLYEFYFFSSC